jgi:hypothetical protein
MESLEEMEELETDRGPLGVRRKGVLEYRELRSCHHIGREFM